MGKIADAFERRDRENLLKMDTRLRDQPVTLPRGKRKGVVTAAPLAGGEISANLIALSDSESADAESFRFLRSRISQWRGGEKPRTIMVTSAFPGEGKTFVASNLAASLAVGAEEQVLLIDCDLKKPSIHEVFGACRTEGVYEYLDRKRELDELILGTKVQGLSMLSAGKVSAHPSESGASHTMERFMKEIKQRFSDWVVIIDTAPVSVAAGTTVIAKHVDAVVFVVMAQRWPRKEIQRSIESLGKEKILGVIFNGYEHGIPGYRKYYSKYYGKQ
jgi:protein-tyrosine kinase